MSSLLCHSKHIIFIGGEECLKDVDQQLWEQAMIQESQPPPPFYSRDFEESAAFLLEQQFGLFHDEITPNTWITVYLHLIQSYEFVES